MNPENWKEAEYEEAPVVRYRARIILPQPDPRPEGEWSISVCVLTPDGSDDVETQYFAANTYPSREEAWEASVDFAKAVIDERVRPQKLGRE